MKCAAQKRADRGKRATQYIDWKSPLYDNVRIEGQPPSYEPRGKRATSITVLLRVLPRMHSGGPLRVFRFVQEGSL